MNIKQKFSLFLRFSPYFRAGNEKILHHSPQSSTIGETFGLYNAVEEKRIFV